MDVRHLDWPLYARTRRLYVRRYAEESAGLLVVLADASGSMGIGGGDKWARVRDIAAVLVFTALRELHQVVLGVVHDGRPLWLPATGGLDFVTEAFDFLGALEPKGATDLAGALAALPKRRLTGHAVILSDFLDPNGLDPALRQLGQRGLNADLGQVRQQGELDCPLGLQSLGDPEGEGVYRLEMSSSKAQEIRSRIQRHDESVGAAVRRHHGRLFNLPVEDELGRSIETLLGQGGRVDAAQA